MRKEINERKERREGTKRKQVKGLLSIPNLVRFSKKEKKTKCYKKEVFFLFFLKKREFLCCRLIQRLICKKVDNLVLEICRERER